MIANPDLIRIATGFGNLDTYTLKSYLNNYGIEVFLSNSYFSAASPHHVFATNGMDIWILARDWPIVEGLIDKYKCDNDQEQNLSSLSTKNNIAFIFLWIVLMLLCATPPPAKGVFFTPPKMIARILTDEVDETTA